MNSAAVQLPRDMMPGRSIMTPALIPERSTVSKCPSSMRMPAQVWQRLSVGGCSPRDNTQGQNTVQLQDSANSPFKLQLSVNERLPLYFSLFPVTNRQSMSSERYRPRPQQALHRWHV